MLHARQGRLIARDLQHEFCRQGAATELIEELAEPAIPGYCLADIVRRPEQIIRGLDRPQAHTRPLAVHGLVINDLIDIRQAAERVRHGRARVGLRGIESAGVAELGMRGRDRRAPGRQAAMGQEEKQLE